MKNVKKSTLLIILCYFGLYLAIGLSLLLKQPFGNPPDEYNRYLIPQYIAQHGTLPNGYEESIRISGYGFSYAFQPILPYMLQGYVMRLVMQFTGSEEALLYAARGVNLALGLLTAGVVLLLSREWFRDRRFGFCFAFLATFLPQSLFIHTYVNTDSCCMLSIAVMLYGLTRGLKSRFSFGDSLIMAVGIILCALSYYNAYGYILSCILLFTASFLSASGQGLSFDGKSFFKKGCFISAIVLAGIGWWFIRSAVLYEGDFLGLRARNECAALYASPEFHPDTRVTWQSQGRSMWEMLTKSDFLTLSVLSFIGIYGAMAIPTSIWIYRFYKALFLIGPVLCIVLRCPMPQEKGRPHDRKPLFKIFYHVNMIFCILMPVILSLIYSYATDYQPQGRYLLPSLLPLCFYTVRGLAKAGGLKAAVPFRGHSSRPGGGISEAWRNRILSCAATLFCLAVVAMSALTVYGYAFPYYEANPVAP